jgi:uncharacterized protein (DUF983 family)
MATATAKGFAVRCIRCGQEECIRLNVNNLDTFSCSACDEDFTADDVRTELARWARLLAWLDTAA